MPQIFEEVGEKLAELGQNVGSQLSQQVVKGSLQSAKKQILPAKEDSAEQKTGKEEFKELLGDLKTMSSADLARAKEKDLKERVSQADRVRAELQAEILKRKNTIDEEIQQIRIKKQQEIPKYIAGKPGEARTQEEKVELWQKEQKEAEKRKKEEEWLKAIKQFQGSKEIGKTVAG